MHSSRRPSSRPARPRARLHEACGLVGPAFVRSVAELAALVACDPFAGRAIDGEGFHMVTFLGAHGAALPALPFVTPRGDVELHAFTENEAFATCRRVGASFGSPNALLERRLGAPATTRNWRTVVRLVKKFA